MTGRTGNSNEHWLQRYQPRISASPLFAGMEPTDLAMLLESATIRSLAHGATLFTQGDPIEEFFMLVAGRVIIHRMSPSGDPNVLKTFGPGAHFALAALFGSGIYPANCTAIAPTEVLCLRRSALLRGLQRAPHIGAGFLTAISRSRDMLMHELAETKGKSAVQRVAGFLLQLAGRNDGPAMVELPFERQILAAHIGVAPETLSRVLAQLGDFGVDATPRIFLVEDIARLRAIADAESGKPLFRLAALLSDLAPQSEGVARIHLPWSHRELATRIGTTSSTVSLTLSRLREFGVQPANRAIEIADLAVLEALYSGKRVTPQPGA